MAIKIAISHKTVYQFDRTVEIFPHIVRLRPAPHCRTPIESYSLNIEPKSHFINWQQDPFANYLGRLVFPERSNLLSFSVELVADMTVINPFDFFLDESAENFPFKYDKNLKHDLAPYLAVSEKGPALQAFLKRIDKTSKPTINFLTHVNSLLQQEIGYNVRMEAGVQDCEFTLTQKTGSCRDSAWLLVQIFRHMGLASRFVSGYLVQLTADVKALDGPSGPTADFTDLHAWTEVFVPGAGWIGLDPTSGLLAAEGHIPLACTPDPISAAPITGATEVCEVEFKHSNVVTRIHEDPRVTKPFTAAQWKNIDGLGKKIDKELKKHKVHLTMGGEPTFVSIDDMESAQWNIAALGDDKRRLAEELLLKLRNEYGKGGVIHFGQGKWYPGEPVPRWALGLYWRTDKQPLWKNNKFLIEKIVPGTTKPEQAQKFMKALCEHLQIDPALAVPGYEDKLHYIAKEGALPANVSIEDNKIKDPLERERLRKVFAQGLDKIIGYALPLAWLTEGNEEGWQSCRWYFKRDVMYLIPGDSPLGYRLPLDSIPWQAPAKDPASFPKDPFSNDDDLNIKPARKQAVKSKIVAKEAEEVIFKTALCIEVRDGRLHVFLPPISRMSHYLVLLDAIETVAVKLKCPIAFEGYEPPRDDRMRKLMITPDPGVIEVNVHPAHDWPELTGIMETLYEAARVNRLGTEKFMLDGKHTGTGGGNHVTMGAAKAEDSPFLRRPDLLGSLIRYWQNHPSLSYLFSGQFIGPTSQSPRVDEARDDNLYELEIALQQLTEGDSKKPWMVDRILRNFLVDLTGNTHRAEFCIDKLYSPDSSTGRLGLVEFRNFEMPPHWQMSALQVLLLRSLVAHFWQHPYTNALINWGTELHDRFMLPHYVWQDLGWVIDDLKRSGYQFELDWFAPFQEFRFPHYGTLHIAGIELDISAAIEPWHVLGEESTGQGTSRYVDSSVERLQVKARNMTSNRFIVTCNGRKLPMQFTGKEGEYVAGVRYKAWAPYSALHPTIPVSSPLVFDVVDTLNSRSLGGCTYHVSHPGGRNYSTFPINANEAEARRVARFWHHGHSQGTKEYRIDEPHPSQPVTLDLRYGMISETKK